MSFFASRQIQLAIGALLFLLLSFIPGYGWLAYISILLGAIESVPAAWETIRARKLDVEFLMILAAVGAIALGRPGEAAVLLFLFSLSKALEDLTMAKTKGAIDALVRLRPATAIAIRNGAQIEIPVEEIVLGDELLLPAFLTAAVDGEVTDGVGSIDTSALTGESIPVSVRPGEKVLAGARNLEFGLKYRATSTIQNSTLQKVVDLVAEAQNNQASGERVSKWFGEKYTWFVLIASLAVFLFRLFVLKLPLREASYQSLTLLVALSPCALVISVPAATLSAMTWAARHGLLIRGGEMIERMGQVTAFTFDKTGTLTEGRPELTEICLCDVECNGSEICWGGNGEFSAEAAEILAYAASAEAQSEHPVGHAVRRSVPVGTPIPVAETIEVIPGGGIRAMIDGKRVLIGQLSLIEQAGLKPTDDFREHFAEIQARGWTVAALAVDHKMAALGFKDGLKKGAIETLEKLRQQGITSMTMLTGDHPRTAEAIAKEVGLKDFHAALMPGDKLAIIDKLSKDHKVAMVGDGINDAPALTQAYVGIAMGGLGSDIALNAADIVLMNDRIEALPELIALGRRTNRIVLSNLIVGGGVIASLTVTSLAGLLPLPIAVVGHEGSTLLVILNGLRLLRGPFAKI